MRRSKGAMIGSLVMDLLLMAVCYGYVVLTILISDRLSDHAGVSRKSSRKFLHAMIGNLPLVIPFFSWRFAPFLVAAPFILVTYVASPVSPFQGLRGRLRGLSELTEEGHHIGLVFYSISYTVLALLFPDRPYVIAAGILPMAYGDSTAALIGVRYGRLRYRIIGWKSVEGSAAMFAATFIALMLSLAYFTLLYPLDLRRLVMPVLAVASVAAVVECFTPKGLDNVTVPAFSALTFLLTFGGA
ncbi:MAG TPA: SEC59/DGK1/VTE5 family protein [Patescibacteria group bacterium]|nr:SEC59/DGK1/VTE5 family protein [Patescibacteria group bacterium]